MPRAFPLGSSGYCCQIDRPRTTLETCQLASTPTTSERRFPENRHRPGFLATGGRQWRRPRQAARGVCQRTGTALGPPGTAKNTWKTRVSKPCVSLGFLSTLGPVTTLCDQGDHAISWVLKQFQKRCKIPIQIGDHAGDHAKCSIRLPCSKNGRGHQSVTIRFFRITEGVTDW